MNSPDARPDLTPRLEFEVVFKNSAGKEIAGIWFVDGAWKLSTDPMSFFSTKAEALEAWKTRFSHDSGLPL
jgi:hypothetical protein